MVIYLQSFINFCCRFINDFLLDILIISSSGDPNLEPPKFSTEPTPLDIVEAAKVVEEVTGGDITEQANVAEETAPILDSQVLFVIFSCFCVLIYYYDVDHRRGNQRINKWFCP